MSKRIISLIIVYQLVFFLPFVCLAFLKFVLAHKPKKFWRLLDLLPKDLLKAQKNLYIYLCNSTSRKKNRQTCLVARFPLQIVTVILPSLGIFPVTNAALLSFFFLILVNSFFKTFTSPCFNSRLNVPVNCFEVHFCCYYCFF